MAYAGGRPKGFKHPPETIEKIRESARRNYHSPENLAMRKDLPMVTAELAVLRVVWSTSSRATQLKFMLEIVEQFFKGLNNG